MQHAYSLHHQEGISLNILRIKLKEQRLEYVPLKPLTRKKKLVNTRVESLTTTAT